MSAANAVGLVLAVAADRVPGGGPALPGAVLMSRLARGRALHRVAAGRRWPWPTGRSATTCTGWRRRRGTCRVERVLYRLIGVDPDGEQSWGVYARSVLAFSAVSILFLYAFLRLQDHLLAVVSASRRSSPPGAWNTAVSFVTNTNWQSYSRRVDDGPPGPDGRPGRAELRLGRRRHRGRRRAGARVRPRRRPSSSGNFWVDLVRICLRILLPVAVVGAVVFVAGRDGAEPLRRHRRHTLAGATQHITGGPVASQEVIKEFGTNGGGFYNANSAHPFENPTTWTNWLEIFLLLVISFSLPRAFGRMVGDNRQGYAIVAVMASWRSAAVIAVNVLQVQHGGTVPQAVGAATEGTETRFGVPQSATFAGRDDADLDRRRGLLPRLLHRPRRHGHDVQHDAGRGRARRHRLRPVRHAGPGRDHGVRRRADGRANARVPRQEDRRPRDEVRVALLPDHADARAGRHRRGDGPARPGRAMLNTRAARAVRGAVRLHLGGATTTGRRSPGISVNTTWYNTALGLAMLFGRFLPMVFVLGLAGLAGPAAARRPRRPARCPPTSRCSSAWSSA